MTSPALGRCAVCGVALEPFHTRCKEHENTLAMDEDEFEEDDYHGDRGWVVVFGGLRGRSCYAAVDPGFGALRFFIEESGLSDPEDAGLDPPDDGFWRIRAKAVEERSWEGERDLVFVTEGEWEGVLPDGDDWKPDPSALKSDPPADR